MNRTIGIDLPLSKDIDLSSVRHVHLDAVGGIAGDMFVAALLDALPALWPVAAAAIAAVQPPEHVTALRADHTDGVLTGSRFYVHGADSDHDESGTHHHHHAWSAIRIRVEAAPLAPSAKHHALSIFTRLATAEAAVHGIASDDVMFHEVGAWDSIVDIIASAALIAALPAHCTWSIGTLPRGSGLVRTAHGMLPVPAPAAEILLRGFELIDDGEDGERITPTGAAILAHLAPGQAADHTPRRLIASGTGFGTKRLRQRSNILRATLYGIGGEKQVVGQDTIEVLRCEIDDQTAEDLAIALAHIRAANGVLDVSQWPVFAKKGRLATAIQVLVRPQSADAVSSLLLDETTTLGVRRMSAIRNIVERETHDVDGTEVKLAHRPSGTTAKAAADALATTKTQAERDMKRTAVERATKRAGDNGE